MKITALLVVIVSCTPPTYAQSTLTNQEMAEAIQIGAKAKGALTGLSLIDSGRAVVAALSANNPNASVGTGFSLRIYTPMTWVEQMASDATKEYRPFTVNDITNEMLAPVLRVVVYPDKPTRLTGAGMATASSAQHVVLRDEAKQLVVQPVSKEPFIQTTSSALRDAAYQGIVAMFPLSAVRDLRGPSGDREFLIIVIGQGRAEKTFKVKQKHFERLPMPGNLERSPAEITQNINPAQAAIVQPRIQEPVTDPTPSAPARAAQPQAPTVVAKVSAPPAEETHDKAASGEPPQAISLRFASTPPNAEVDIDGAYWGTTPTTNLSRLTAGPHTIVIRKAGYQRWERKIELTPGDDRAVNAELETDSTKPHIVGLD